MEIKIIAVDNQKIKSDPIVSESDKRTMITIETKTAQGNIEQHYVVITDCGKFCKLNAN